MMNIKSIWLYTALAACFGVGYGAGVAMSPSQSDLAQAINQAQQASMQNCEMTASYSQMLCTVA